MHWRLKDGTVTIYGTGAMYDYEDTAPWHDYRNELTAAVVESGVTTLGESAFYDCHSILSVSIPDTVTTIEDYAFMNCIGLTDIILPDSVRVIGLAAFEGCENLSNITLSANLLTIGNCVFEDCLRLNEITIPAKVTSIGLSAFSNCRNLQSITFLGNAPEFGSTAFQGVSDAVAYYPANDSTWTEDVRQGYGGNITWVKNGEDVEQYGITLGTTPVTSGNLSGENWSYDPANNILLLETGFDSSISVTVDKLKIIVRGNVEADKIRVTADSLTIQGEDSSELKVTDSGFEMQGSSLTIENLTLRVINQSAYGNGIVVGTLNSNGYTWSGTGTLTIEDSYVTASSTIGDYSRHGILAGTLNVENSYVYGRTSHTSLSGGISTTNCSISSDSHVEGSAVTGSGFTSSNLTVTDAYFHNTGRDGTQTLEKKSINNDLYNSGCEFHCIGSAHVEYKQTEDGTNHELACKCAVNPQKLADPEAHSWIFTAQDDTIAALCNICLAESSLKLLPPANLISNSTTPREATIEGSIPGVEMPEITYEGFVLSGGKPARAGQYTASITVAEVTASITFTLESTTVATVTLADGTVYTRTELEDAMSLAGQNENSTLTLLTDQTPRSTFWLNNSKFTLDLNGYSMINSTDVCFRVNETAELTVKDSVGTGVISGSNKYDVSQGSAGGTFINKGKLTILSGIITYDTEAAWSNPIRNSGELIVEGGQLGTSTDMWVLGNGGTATINGGIIKGKMDLGSGTVTINGGTFEAKEQDIYGAQVTINDGSFINGLKITATGYNTPYSKIYIQGGIFAEQLEHEGGTLTLSGGVFEKGLYVAEGTLSKLLAEGCYFADVNTGEKLDNYGLTNENSGACTVTQVSNETVKNRLILDSTEFSGHTSVWIDGVEMAIQKNDDLWYIDLPDENARVMTLYTYHVDTNLEVDVEAHRRYPVSMKVWDLCNEDGIYTAAYVEELNDILQYSGSSIRVTGKQGVRMITSMEKSKKNSLISDGLAGYTLKEYGTVVAWASQLERGNPLILGKSYAMSNYAYRKDVADPVFAYVGSLMQYTNVLVGFSMDQCRNDLAMRPYMILKDAEGAEIIIYGGIVQRSIGYIAAQNANTFDSVTEASASNYVWNIIRYVYGDDYVPKAA